MLSISLTALAIGSLLSAKPRALGKVQRASTRSELPQTDDYYFKRFGRHGLDNQDLPITVITHPVRRADLATASSDVIGLLYLNAFYAGDGVVVYGEGA